ncbi:MAG: hypothetical protein ACJAWS_002897 [Oleiphilaceae bacterium]
MDKLVKLLINKQYCVVSYSRKNIEAKAIKNSMWEIGIEPSEIALVCIDQKLE